MSTNLSLILTASTLIGCGVYLILERSLTRVLVGLLIMGNGVNILFQTSGGRAGWNIVTTGTDLAAANFGLDAHPDHADRYARAREVVDAVVSLSTCLLVSS